jgi:hypothetical protein
MKRVIFAAVARILYSGLYIVVLTTDALLARNASMRI